MRRLATTTAALLLGCVAAVAPLTPASAAPVLTLGLSANSSALPGDPVLVSTASDAPVAFTIGVSEPAADVHVSVAGDGLVLSQPAPSYAAVAAPGVSGELRVRATTAGFHTLTVTVTADGAAPVTVPLDRLWAPTDTASVPATGSLAGRTVAYDSTYTSFGKTYRQSNLLWFLDAGAAYLGNVDGGRPDCRHRADSWSGESGCLPYAYDATTGLLQVGRNIGLVRPDGVSLSGYGVGEVDDDGDATTAPGEVADLEHFTIPLGFAKAGSRFAGTFRYSWTDPIDGRLQVSLVTRRDGTFHLHVPGVKPSDGRYAVRRHGVLRLTGRGLRARSHTFLAVLGPGGTARPQATGAWLTYFYDYGRTSFTEGYPLRAGR